MQLKLLEKRRNKMITNSIKVLFMGDEFTHLSDSDQVNIVLETYKLYPELFMNSIYPKMASWDFPSFLNVKEEIVELLKKEGAKIN